jgi:Ca2+-binding EF-hand superfamily protein
MRRILRKIAAAEFDQLGDTSTLADPGVVEHLVRSLSEQQRAELRETFELIDGDRDGCIVHPEFQALVRSLKAEMPDDEIDRSFGRLDADRDGRITFDEFAAWWLSPS